MKIRIGIKIALLVSSILIFGFLLFAIYSVLIVKAEKFEYSMLILFAVTMAGFLSVIYQAKTLKYYKLDSIIITSNIKVFWVGNLLFSIALFCFSLYFLYFIYSVLYGLNRMVYSDYLFPLAICLYVLLVAVFLAIEASVLYKRFKNLEVQRITDSIDDIKGHQDEDFDF